VKGCLHDGAVLPLQVANYLSTTSFADLTGCPAQCTYQDTRYGSQPLPGINWGSPTLDGDRNASTKQCIKPTPRPPTNDRSGSTSASGGLWTDTDLALTEPTIIDTSSRSGLPLCTNTLYKEMQVTCRAAAANELLACPP
jgi:hypothetical protein